MSLIVTYDYAYVGGRVYIPHRTLTISPVSTSRLSSFFTAFGCPSIAATSSAVLFSLSASSERICSRKGTRSGAPPLNPLKTRFACLEEHPKTRSTSSLLDSAVNFSRSASKCSRVAIISGSLWSPPAISKSSQSKRSVSGLSVMSGSAKLEMSTTVLSAQRSNPVRWRVRVSTRTTPCS